MQEVVEQIPSVETVIEDIPVTSFEASYRPVTPISDGDPETNYLQE